MTPPEPPDLEAIRRRLEESRSSDSDIQYPASFATDLAALCDRVERLEKALGRMVRTHGMHGPCKGNDCTTCRAAYNIARAALAADPPLGA